VLFSFDARATHTRERSFRFWALLLAVACFVALEIDQVRRIGDFRVDDAYITFSFSKNLASGHGPVYSHDLRVEGYSNFLWMVLVAGTHALGLDLYLGARLLAFSCLLLCFRAVFVFVRNAGSEWAAAIAVILLACCSDLTRAALSGLETVAFSAALCSAYSGYLRESAHKVRWSLLWLVPVLLLRIDGFVPVAFALSIEACSAVLGRRLSFRRLFWVVIPIVSVGLIYFAWRYRYYGLPLSSTYYAKSLVAAQDPGRGFRQLLEWAQDYGLVYTSPLALLALLGRHRKQALVLVAAIVLHSAYVTRVGGDWMPFWRFFQPIVPLIVMLCGLGMATALSVWNAWDATAARRVLRRITRFVLALAALAALTVLAVRMHMGSVNGPEEGAKLAHAGHVKTHTHDNLLMATDLARHVIRTPGDRLVSDYAGVFAVFTDANIIDMWGLANAQIARFGGIEGINSIYGKECAACYPSLDPDYFHVVVPLVRKTSTFSSHKAVVREVFQSSAIGRYLDFKKYVAGYVVEDSTGRAFWFLEKKRKQVSLVERSPAPGIRVVYPFGRGK
jgi:hypothetical protein